MKKARYISPVASDKIIVSTNREIERKVSHEN
jgi:hypothetical protein